MSDIERYDRQVRLFGVDGQHSIASSSVGIVGLGGLGSHVAQQLAHLGVVSYILVDSDQPWRLFVDDEALFDAIDVTRVPARLRTLVVPLSAGWHRVVVKLA